MEQQEGVTRSFYVGAAIYGIKHGKLVFLTIGVKTTNPLYPHQPEQMKFPGGKKEETDAGLLAALEHELFDETGLRIKKGVIPKVIWVSIGPDDDYPSDYHEKVFYLFKFDELEGELRTEEIRDGSSILRVPEWATLRDLTFLYKTHRPASRAAVQAISLKG